MDAYSIYRDCFNYYLYDICGGSRNQLGKELDISPSNVGKMLRRFKQGGGMGQNADKVLYHLAVEHGVSIDFLIGCMLRNNLFEEVGRGIFDAGRSAGTLRGEPPEGGLLQPGKSGCDGYRDVEGGGRHLSAGKMPVYFRAAEAEMHLPAHGYGNGESAGYCPGRAL